MSRFRNALLGDSGWGQALPIAAAVFAAGVFVAVFVDASQKRGGVTRGAVAVSRAASADSAPPSGLSEGSVLVDSALVPGNPSIALGARVAVAAVPSLRPFSDAPHEILTGARLQSVSRTRTKKPGAFLLAAEAEHVRHRSEVLATSLRPARALIESSARPVDMNEASVLQRVAAITQPSLLTRRAGIVAFSPVYGPGANERDASRIASRETVAYAGPAHREYADDDGPAASVSILDVTGSARRQQGLFSSY